MPETYPLCFALHTLAIICVCWTYGTMITVPSTDLNMVMYRHSGQSTLRVLTTLETYSLCPGPHYDLPGGQGVCPGRPRRNVHHASTFAGND